MTCTCKKNKKTEENNQWAGTAAIGNCCDCQEKTEFSNEWVSTNKLATQENPNKQPKK